MATEKQNFVFLIESRLIIFTQNHRKTVNQPNIVMELISKISNVKCLSNCDEFTTST